MAQEGTRRGRSDKTPETKYYRHNEIGTPRGGSKSARDRRPRSPTPVMSTLAMAMAALGGMGEACAAVAQRGPIVSTATVLADPGTSADRAEARSRRLGGCSRSFRRSRQGRRRHGRRSDAAAEATDQLWRRRSSIRW